MRRSARIAALYGTEWSNRPSLRALRKQSTEELLRIWSNRYQAHDPLAEQHRIHDLLKTNQKVLYEQQKVHHVTIPTRGTCTITYDQVCYDRDKIQVLLNLVNSKSEPIDRAHAAIPLFQYLHANPCILFLNPRLMETVIQRIAHLTSEIAQHEKKLQPYFNAADQMSATLYYLHAEIGGEILNMGMKKKIEERDVWRHLKSVMAELHEILLSEPAAVSTSCLHSKKIENESAPYHDNHESPNSHRSQDPVR